MAERTKAHESESRSASVNGAPETSATESSATESSATESSAAESSNPELEITNLEHQTPEHQALEHQTLGATAATHESLNPRDAEDRVSDYDGEFDPSYKTMSKAAVVSIGFAVLSFSGFLFAGGVMFSVLGMGAAVIAMLGIRKYPHELSGTRVATLGLILCSVTFLGASSMHTYIYLTEVPPDHVRLTFGEIKAPKYKQYTPTQRAMELDGQKVFIKGYTFPGKQKKNLSQFLLVGDFGQCCFGGNPEPSHLVKVSIKNGRKIDYSQRLRKLSGTFRVLDQVGTNQEGKGYLYEIAADDIK